LEVNTKQMITRKLAVLKPSLDTGASKYKPLSTSLPATRGKRGTGYQKKSAKNNQNEIKVQIMRRGSTTGNEISSNSSDSAPLPSPIAPSKKMVTFRDEKLTPLDIGMQSPTANGDLVHLESQELVSDEVTKPLVIISPFLSPHQYHQQSEITATVPLSSNNHLDMAAVMKSLDESSILFVPAENGSGNTIDSLQHQQQITNNNNRYRPKVLKHKKHSNNRKRVPDVDIPELPMKQSRSVTPTLFTKRLWRPGSARSSSARSSITSDSSMLTLSARSYFHQRPENAQKRPSSAPGRRKKDSNKKLNDCLMISSRHPESESIKSAKELMENISQQSDLANFLITSNSNIDVTSSVEKTTNGSITQITSDYSNR
jgi:hypothetical protein